MTGSHGSSVQQCVCGCHRMGACNQTLPTVRHHASCFALFDCDDQLGEFLNRVNQDARVPVIALTHLPRFLFGFNTRLDFKSVANVQLFHNSLWRLQPRNQLDSNAQLIDPTMHLLWWISIHDSVGCTKHQTTNSSVSRTGQPSSPSDTTIPPVAQGMPLLHSAGPLVVCPKCLTPSRVVHRQAPNVFDSHCGFIDLFHFNFI